MSKQQIDFERRLRDVEDKLAIYELIAAHPPSADTGSADYTISVYRDDGVFDRGSGLDGAEGAEAIAAFIRRPEHAAAIRDGLAHFTGLPLIALNGERAVVTSYLMIAHLDHQGSPRHLPNHGVSTGYRVHRAVVNRWELVRSDGSWKIVRRTLLPVDGSTEHQRLLRRGLEDAVLQDRLFSASSCDLSPASSE
ncbi:nuclear transport factor 2 family protein [Novosphingobium resinovorum]|uniref:nuclear transport factor 2 family protein n=1 Tax=Novosphingobium resinovorum TaxID=158500 RepID=UPI002ED5EE33|nr:nuclear transport factor 2 family protein [Novosphingobium resinovorum]